jgi:predicted nucleic acid-binding protein
MIFVDTGAWYASLVEDEPHHDDVVAWVNGNTEPLITTDFCIAETLNLFVARKRPKLATAFSKSVFGGRLCRLHILTERELVRTVPLFQTKCVVGWSFTDCTSQTVIGDLGIQTALALDQHFRQFGIRIVP